MRLTLAEIADAGSRDTEAPATVVGDAATEVDGFANDSRTIVPGECFVAIRDARDGHDFVDACLLYTSPSPRD